MSGIRTSVVGPRSVVYGFTLIELMVVVSVVAIIAAVALPSYRNSVIKGRRADAMAGISAIQQSQERWRGNNPAYSTSLTDLGVVAPPLYGLAITAPTSDATTLSRGYIVTATAQGAQASDPECARMSVRMFEGNLTYAGCAACSTFTYTTSQPCFRR